MKTEDLIAAMAHDTRPARPLRTYLLWGLIPAIAIGIGALWEFYGFRVDLAQSLLNPLSVARFVVMGALGLCALRIAVLLARPVGQVRFWPLVLVGLVAAGLLGFAFLTTPAEGRQMAIVGKTMVYCLTTIPLLAVLPVVAILAMLQHGAATAPRLASAMAGLAGGGLGAFIYALHCTEDSPLFYITWYGLAIAGVTCASTVIGPRLLRW